MCPQVTIYYTKTNMVTVTGKDDTVIEHHIIAMFVLVSYRQIVSMAEMCVVVLDGGCC